MTQLEEVTDKIKAFVRKPGYIYSFLMTIVRNCFYDANNPAEYENRDKLITEELMTLLGFWLQCPEPRFSYPDSFEALYEMMTGAEELMNEMHKASYEIVIAEMREKLNKPFDIRHKHPSKFLSEKAKAQSIQEAIYYHGDYAYDFEYVHFLTKKYKYDKDWLLQNKSFDLDEAGNIALTIKELLRKKANKLHFPNYSFDFKQFGYDNEGEFKMTMEFATYVELIPPFDENSTESEVLNSLHSFCDSLVDLFSLDENDLKSFSSGQAFLDLFSLDLHKDNNLGYSRFGDYNVLQAKPIIHLRSDHYLIPLVYQLFVALYETPFYWIMEDKHYAKTAGTHRGKAGEDMANEILLPLFGNNRILRDIEIKDSKHHTITDIDNLCLLGTKAICIQIKSKRLSQASRTGSLQQLTHDFKLAVQDAYEQALLCRKHLIDQNGIFFWSKENQCKVDIRTVEAEALEADGWEEKLSDVCGILVPGGFGLRGLEGKMRAIRYAREYNVPFLGICLGMQIAVIEFARNVAGIKNAHSGEFARDVEKVIDYLPDQNDKTDKGGTLRLGAYPCVLQDDTKIKAAYDKTNISERHRHRYEFNNEYREVLQEAGLTLSGLSPDNNLVETVEINDRDFYIGVQYHPEFKSRPNKPHPLFSAFIKAALKE